jgi:hypothetical protein
MALHYSSIIKEKDIGEWSSGVVMEDAQWGDVSAGFLTRLLANNDE